jgi:hypothetical protein
MARIINGLVSVGPIVLISAQIDEPIHASLRAERAIGRLAKPLMIVRNCRR